MSALKASLAPQLAFWLRRLGEDPISTPPTRCPLAKRFTHSASAIPLSTSVEKKRLRPRASLTTSSRPGS